MVVSSVHAMFSYRSPQIKMKNEKYAQTCLYSRRIIAQSPLVGENQRKQEHYLIISQFLILAIHSKQNSQFWKISIVRERESWTVQPTKSWAANGEEMAYSPRIVDRIRTSLHIVGAMANWECRNISSSFIVIDFQSTIENTSDLKPWPLVNKSNPRVLYTRTEGCGCKIKDLVRETTGDFPISVSRLFWPPSLALYNPLMSLSALLLLLLSSCFHFRGLTTANSFPPFSAETPVSATLQPCSAIVRTILPIASPWPVRAISLSMIGPWPHSACSILCIGPCALGFFAGLSYSRPVFFPLWPYNRNTFSIEKPFLVVKREMWGCEAATHDLLHSWYDIDGRPRQRWLSFSRKLLIEWVGVKRPRSLKSTGKQNHLR